MRAVIVCCLLSGCVESPDIHETEQAIVEANGVSLNGVSLNGVSLNGVSLNGVSLNGVSLNGVSLNGVSLNGVSLNGVSLNGVSLDGSALTGVRSDTGAVLSVSAIGSAMTAQLSNGGTLVLYVESAAQLASGTWTYGIAYDSDVGRLPLCGDRSITALAVAGTWNTESGVADGGAYAPSTTLFTLACRGKSIAKCVELGYPAATRASELASCVRLLRGDYCGDGTAYTTTGMTLNLYDHAGIQVDTEAWLLEAEWTPSGARCVTLERESRFLVDGRTPPCLASRALSATRTCAKGFGSGAYLISEVPDDQVSSLFLTTKTTLSRQSK